MTSYERSRACAGGTCADGVCAGTWAAAFAKQICLWWQALSVRKARTLQLCCGQSSSDHLHPWISSLACTGRTGLWSSSSGWLSCTRNGWENDALSKRGVPEHVSCSAAAQRPARPVGYMKSIYLYIQYIYRERRVWKIYSERRRGRSLGIDRYEIFAVCKIVCVID